MFDASKIEDADPDETREWLESIDSVLRVHGAERAHYLLERLIDYTRRFLRRGKKGLPSPTRLGRFW